MRLTLVTALLLLALPSCRRPPPHHSGVAPMPAATEKAAPEEDEPEAAPPAPAPPPPPAKPTSAPPPGEAGFTFGQTRREAMNICTTKAVWRREGQNYACTQPVEDPGFAGNPVLSFCDDKLCAIGIALTPAGGAFATWEQAFNQVREKLVARHGEPTTSSEQIPEECKSDGFVGCLDAGKAHKELTWAWDGHVVVLRMSKRKSGDGPSAIRFVSMPKAATAPAAQ